MEKRFLLAMVLSIAVIFLWSKFFVPPPPKPDPADEQSSGAASRPSSETRPATDSAPSAATQGNAATRPEFPRRVGEAPLRQSVRLSSGTLSLEVDTLGALVREATLRDYSANVRTGANGEKLHLVETYADSPTGLSLVDSDDMTRRFLDSQIWTLSEQDGERSATFTLTVEEANAAWEIQKTLRLEESQHRVRVDLGFRLIRSTNNQVNKRFWLAPTGGVHLREEPPTFVSRSIAAVVTRTDLEIQTQNLSQLADRESKTLDLASSDAVFVGDVATYFGAYLRLVSRDRAIGARIRSATGSGAVGDLSSTGPSRTYSELGVLFPAELGKPPVMAEFDYYLGPKDHRAIKAAYAEGEIRDLYLDVADFELTAQGAFCCSNRFIDGVVHFVAKFVLQGLDFLRRLTGSVGLSIICLTFIVRLLLFPINRRSQATMQLHGMKMQRLKPKLDRLKEQYKDNQQAYAQEQIKLMREEKVSFLPLGGCLPMFLQIPIFFGLFSAIRFDVALRHAEFLWVADLSRPDNLLTWAPMTIPCCFGPGIVIDGLNILPILMTIAWFIDAKMTPITSDDPQLVQQQKMMMFMPFLFGFMLYSYAAGLSLYWLTSSLIGIFEKRVIKKFFPVVLPGIEPATKG